MAVRLARAASKLVDDRLCHWHGVALMSNFLSERAAVPFRGAKGDAAVDCQAGLDLIALEKADMPELLGRNARGPAIAPFETSRFMDDSVEIQTRITILASVFRLRHSARQPAPKP